MKLDPLLASNAKAETSRCIVVFHLEDQRYALWLAAVERVTRMLALVPIPKAPSIVLGAFNFQGAVVPVVDLRQRFGLPAREPRLEDQLLLARTRRRKVALASDSVEGVERVALEDWVSPGDVIPGTAWLAGVVKRPDGLILIHDLDTFLSLEEENALEEALAGEAETP